MNNRAIIFIATGKATETLIGVNIMERRHPIQKQNQKTYKTKQETKQTKPFFFFFFLELVI